jgi:hypothetical protein
MSGTGQPRDVSFFRSHYIIILCIGVVLFTAPQWIKALLEWHFEWTYLYEWASKLGEAAIIGVVVGYFLDKILMKSADRHGQALERQVQDQHIRYTTIINTSITDLKRDVFLGAIGVGIERDIFSLFKQTIVECPVYRDPMRMRITMTLEHHKQGNDDVPVLRCDWYEEYSIRGLQSPITDYDFEISQSTDDLPFMEPQSGITKVTIDGVTVAGTPTAPFVGIREGRLLHLQEIPENPPRHSAENRKLFHRLQNPNRQRLLRDGNANQKPRSRGRRHRVQIKRPSPYHGRGRLVPRGPSRHERKHLSLAPQKCHASPPRRSHPMGPHTGDQNMITTDRTPPIQGHKKG